MKNLIERYNYFNRIFSSYILKKNSQLTFWHGIPENNKDADYGKLGQYYMLFPYKANYPGPFDEDGIPKLNYHGTVGLQYNPIAIAQYALAHYNIFKNENNIKNYNIFITQATWLHKNLRMNNMGQMVWQHDFDWEYATKLQKGWYSGLAQGQGLSVLLRAHQLTGEEKYFLSSKKVLDTLMRSIEEGGVVFRDAENNNWIEEYLVRPPTHILNGFIWALWGIYDYWLYTRDADIKKLFDDYVETLNKNLDRYDVGYWSLYELSRFKMKMLSSQFYHLLHIQQLIVLYKMTRIEKFDYYTNRWSEYYNKKIYRLYSFIYKTIFKLKYY